MKYLKLFEGFNREDIKSICRKYKIENYIINEDGTVDVDGNVNLSHKGLTKIPLKFRNVSGYFDCSYNQLKTSEGCPQSVGGSFYCFANQLTSLEGCPQSVGDIFECSSNNIVNLENGPESVGGDFRCSSNKLTTLEGGPKTVGGDFNCDGNQLISLKGAPQSIGGDFYCRYNKLTILEECLPSIGGDFNCRYNQLTTLEGIGIISGDIYYSNNPCRSIYKGWINGDRREELLDLMEDYDFLRGEEIYWERLEAFYKDSGLKIPDREELEKYYTIIE